MLPPSWLTALCAPARPIRPFSCFSSARSRPPARCWLPSTRPSAPGCARWPARARRRPDPAERRLGRVRRPRRRASPSRRATPTPSSRPATPAPPSPPPRSAWAAGPACAARRWPPCCPPPPAGSCCSTSAPRSTRDEQTLASTPGWAPRTPRSCTTSPRPRVGLLTIGTERGKGDRLRRAAPAVLAAADLPAGARYIGLVEGNDVVIGAAADVVVTDGFTGNVLLKGLETAYALVGVRRSARTCRRAPPSCSASPAPSWSATAPPPAPTSPPASRWPPTCTAAPRSPQPIAATRCDDTTR